jgi:DNA modification methylase
MEPITFDPYTIYRGDCLEILKHFPSNCVDLIYVDPPFNSNRNYEVFWGDTAEKRAFDDRHTDAMAYVNYMRPRIAEHFRVLKKTGSFYYHCDWHASHHIRVMLDEIFGANYFQNEIVWYYRGAGVGPKRWARRHDILFFYTKGKEWYFNPDPARQPYADATVERFKHYIGNVRDGQDFGVQELNPLGKHPDDVFCDIQPIAPSARIRLGYPTQKPLPLLERLISVSSKEGDIVLDGFCGCGTTLVASENLNRKWLGIDISPTACRVMGERIVQIGRKELPITGVRKRGAKYFQFSNLPMSIPQLKALPPFEFENWAVLAVGQFFNMYAQPNRSKVGDLGIDGRLYLPSNVEKHSSKDSEKTPLFKTVEGEKYIPIQVKQKEKVGRPDIDKFYAAMERDGRTVGVFVAFGFSRDAYSEISRLNRTDHNPKRIIPLTVERLLANDFSAELEVWMGEE